MLLRPLPFLVAGLTSLLVLGHVTRGAAQVKRVTRPLLRPTQYQGMRFFPSLKWRITLGMRGHSVPALADLDLDGKMDLILPAADGNLYRLTEDGNVLWKAELAAAGPSATDPPADGQPSAKGAPAARAEAAGDENPAADGTVGVTLGDVDRNGTLDILVSVGGTLLCLAPDGKEQWTYELNEPIQSFATVADLEGDGSPEVLFGANDNRLHVLSGDGNEKWSFETRSWIVGGVATADLDGNGRLEVVFGSMDYKVYCLDSTGKLEWEFETEDWVQSSPCIADVDRDGGRDVVVAADDGTLYCLSRRGTLKWKEELAGAARQRVYLAVADLDGEGTLETVAALPTGQIMVYTAFGDRAWARSVGGGVQGSPLIADLNGDGWQDLLVATAAGQLVALDTWGGTAWQHSLGHTIEATPVLADLDRDRKYEIYVANLIPSNRQIGFFSQYEISVAGGKGAWMTLKGDPYRTGFSGNAVDYAQALRRGADYATAWEPFLAGYRPRTGVQPPRRLRVAALPLDDRLGNRDGALDPGETATWKIQVTNLGKGASYDSLLSVDFGKSRISLDRSSMYLGWIAPGATKTATFRVTAPPATAGSGSSAAEALGNATARLQVKESGVQAAVAEARVVKVPSLAPVLRIARRQLVDRAGAVTSGNGNGRLDSGESAILRLLLVNDRLSTAKAATARLTSGSTDVLVATPTAQLRSIVPYGGRQVDFGLRVARQLAGRSVTLTLTTQAAGAPPHVEKIVLPLGQGAVDTHAPRITMTVPSSRISVTRRDRITISGTVSDPADVAAFRFDKQGVPLGELARVRPGVYRFSFPRELKVGENVFPVSATDGAGNSVTLWLRVVRRP